MEENNISCFYYPTTVVVVDDNKSFLEKFQYSIGKDILCKTYSDPEEALAYIQNTVKKDAILKHIIAVDESSEHYSHASGQLPLQYDVSKIYEHVYNKDRFSEVSLIIVDYAMPSMNGEELCRRLKQIDGNSAKIIMLTGEADDPKAITLFNKGIIDKFLRKGQPNLEVDLKNSIIEMQKRYFLDLTYPIMQGLSSDKDSSLGDPIFRDLFNKIYLDIAASSYYLIELSGSFLFMDNAGVPTFLIIKTLDELEEIAEQIDKNKLPRKLIESVKNGELIPYFSHSSDDFDAEASVFEKHLYKAKKLKGKKDYVYALVNDLEGFSLKRDKILSFNEHIVSVQ